MEFSKDEMYLMMLYSPGTKSGLVEALKQMKMQLTQEETELCSMTRPAFMKMTSSRICSTSAIRWVEIMTAASGS